MTQTELPVTNGKVAAGAFGLLIILSLLWLAGGTISGIIHNYTFNFPLMFGPLLVVILLQMLFTWLGATIKSHVAQGVVLGLTQYTILEEMRKNRENVH